MIGRPITFVLGVRGKRNASQQARSVLMPPAPKNFWLLNIAMMPMLSLKLDTQDMLNEASDKVAYGIL